MEIISRKEAIERGLKFYFTGKPCKRGHVAERRVDSSDCVECRRERDRKYREENPEKVREYNRKYYEENREVLLEYGRKWYEENREHRAESIRKWKEANPEKVVEMRRNHYQENRFHCNEYMRQHYQDNKSYYYAKGAKRRAAKLERTLPGYDSEIAEIYAEAQRMNELGFNVEVDHIIPLQGETASGLHHPNNLQIISMEENRSKNNKLLPEHMIEIY